MKNSRFDDLLSAYTTAKSEKERHITEQRLWQEFGVKGAVFVLDMSGFSSITQRLGIVHYLSMIQSMQNIVKPIITERYAGEIIKFEADNCFAYFSEVIHAIRAGIEINRATGAANRTNPKELDIMLSCGIDYGDFLMISGMDLFGDPVNKACKLGEDISKPGEILVTTTAMERVDKAESFGCEAVYCTLSGIALEANRIVY